MKSVSKRTAVVALVVTLVATLAALVAPSPAQAAYANPQFVRTIGARGEVAMYAWGIQYNPVTQRMLVGDYWNYQIRQLDGQGNVVNSFFRTPRNGQPYSLAVDPIDGDIYVPEIADGGDAGIIAKYDKNGTFMWQLDVDARYVAWITVDNSGYLYVADSHYWNNTLDPPKIRKYTVNDTTKRTSLVASWGSYGSTPGKIGRINGVATDAAGNVYGADAINRVIHKWTSTGTWLGDFGSEGNAVGQFTGDMRGMTIDQANGWLYVVDAEASQIEKFTLSGTPILNFGSEGFGPGQFSDGGRQVDLDGAGNVWVADYGNSRVQKFSPTGGLLDMYPNPAAGPQPGGFAQVRDVAVDPTNGKVFGADTFNQRFMRFNTDGTFDGTWGFRNSHEPYGMNYPRGIAVDPVRRNVWVANTREHKIRVYDPDMNHLFSLGEDDSSSTGNFRWPMDIEFAPGDKVVVSDYTSGKVKTLSAATGQELDDIDRTNNGVAVNPANGDIWVLSYSTDNIRVYTASGSTRFTFGSSGTGNGQFRNPWDVTIVNGVAYVTDAQLNRVQAFDLNGSYLGQWGAQGVKPGQFNNPSGITHDPAGNIYVADAGNDRIQVFSPTIGAPGADTAKAVPTITVPTMNQVFPGSAPMLSGSVTDNVRNGTVEVAIRDRDGLLWWNAKIATWGTIKTWNLAAMSGTDLTSMNWAFPFLGAKYAGRYFAQVRATDAVGNVSTVFPQQNFSLEAAPNQDTAPADTQLVAPAYDAVLPNVPVTFSGGAVDNVGVTGVEVAIQDRVSKLWWDPATSTWASGQKWLAGTVNTPGATSTNWTAVWNEPTSAGSGSYFATARSLDAAGNVETVRPNTRFSVL